ncbi:hypothetical protein Tco_0845782 [Tanacetum coccineum]
MLGQEVNHIWRYVFYGTLTQNQMWRTGRRDTKWSLSCNPLYKFNQAVVAAEGRPAVPQHTSVETILNMTPENKEHFQSGKEAILLLLTVDKEQLDTKANGEYLRKCIFDGPYKLTSVVIEAVAATVNSPEVPEHDEAETIHNMSEENKLYFKAEKEAIFLLLTGIGDEIYSTVDACNTANEMWTVIERLQQDGESMESYYSRFYKLMNELTRNNLQVSPMQVNVQFLQQLQPEWSRFVTVVKQRQEIDTVSYHKLFDVLKQFQNEVNDIRSERLARSANLLALLGQRPLTVAGVKEIVGETRLTKNAAECVDERDALANLIANLTLDTEENKTILKQLKKANASLTQELEECRTNLDETGRALREATSCWDSCLFAL